MIRDLDYSMNYSIFRIINRKFQNEQSQQCIQHEKRPKKNQSPSGKWPKNTAHLPSNAHEHSEKKSQSKLGKTSNKQTRQRLFACPCIKNLHAALSANARSVWKLPCRVFVFLSLFPALLFSFSFVPFIIFISIYSRLCVSYRVYVCSAAFCLLCANYFCLLLLDQTYAVKCVWEKIKLTVTST